MRFCTISSPFGPVTIAGDDGGLEWIWFTAGRWSAAPTVDGWLERPRDPLLRETAAQLRAYFKGALKEFDLPLAPDGTAFQRKVWSKLLGIAYGKTTTYSALARRVGRPEAFRAVGAANGRNPISIVIPCHRVLGKSGSLTGYGGGIETKRGLLELESA